MGGRKHQWFKVYCLCGALLVLVSGRVEAQRIAEPNLGEVGASVTEDVSSPIPAPVQRILQPRGPYALGPGDQVSIRALHLEDITPEARRVDEMGDIQIPLLGRVHAAGLTARELELELVSKLNVFTEGTPDVQVTVVGFRSRPVSVIGAVNRPGSFEMIDSRSLLEVLLIAGGLSKDADSKVRITRRMENGRIPLDDAQVDPSGQFSYVDVDTNGLLQADNASRNIKIVAEDVILVTASNQIYVIGEVVKPGPLSLGDGGKLSAIQAISMASGFSPDAARKNAKIIRPMPGSVRQEIALDLNKVFKGELEDPLLKPGDTLYVPGSAGKKFARTVAAGAVVAGITSAIYLLIRY